MNSHTYQQPPQDDGDEINLLEMFDVVLESRWLIAGITALALAVLGAVPLLQGATTLLRKP